MKIRNIPANVAADPADEQLLERIANRAFEHRYTADRLAARTALAIAHLNGCPLDLEGLLTCRPVDLAHDVCGIADNMDWRTGQLMNGFRPRLAK